MVTIQSKTAARRERGPHPHSLQANLATPRLPAAGEAPDDLRLFELQLVFNLFPADYVHASWFEAPGWDMCAVGETPRSVFWMRQCSATLLRERRLDRQFDWDFSDRGKRLALIDGSTLVRLGRLASAVLMRDHLRRLVCRDEVQEMQRLLGREAHVYAVRWRGSVLTLNQHPGLAWEADGSKLGGLTLSVRSEAEQAPDNSEGSLAAACGRRCVDLLMAAIPTGASGVRGRLQLKLPRCWVDETGYGVRCTEAQRDELTRLFAAIVVDVCPQWAWLFAGRPGMATA